MDEKIIVKQILALYDEIKVLREEEQIIFFELFDKEYGLWYPLKEHTSQMPILLVRHEDKFAYPHVSPRRVPLNEKTKEEYRHVCLYEDGSTIRYLQSYEEKISDTIQRLFELISLSPLEIEREYQKEFLYYWNDVAINTMEISLFIGKMRSFQKLNAYTNAKKELRFVADDIVLNDKNLWRHIADFPAFYIPIVDNRRILPPTEDNMWNYKNVLMLVCGREYNRISNECYTRISKEKVKAKRIGLVFEMIVDGNRMNFTTIVRFKHTTSDILLNKLRNDIADIQIVRSKRTDYYFLCQQIGNDTNILDKKVLLVGDGSLGSYVARDLVKSGIRNLTIYDSDILEEDNLLRHNVNKLGLNDYKVIETKKELELIHPEIHVNPCPEYLDEKHLLKEMNSYDLIIFTVGSSDVQLSSNNLLSITQCKVPVIYTWLEAGGEYSHILFVDYKKQGCFECLFTDKEGSLINNKVNIATDFQVEKKTLRGGCGATRVAYGTEVLLRTTAVLLDTIKKAFDGSDKENFLLDINPTNVINKGNSFIERKCKCCGDKNRE